MKKPTKKPDEAHDENKLKKLGESDKKRVREWSTSLKREFDDQTSFTRRIPETTKEYEQGFDEISFSAS